MKRKYLKQKARCLNHSKPLCCNDKRGEININDKVFLSKYDLMSYVKPRCFSDNCKKLV